MNKSLQIAVFQAARTILAAKKKITTNDNVELTVSRHEL